MRLLALIAFSIFLLPQITLAADQSTPAKQAYLIDNETGQVLLAKNAQEKMPTSSMSKVMTAYLIFDALKNGTITPESNFVVSEKAWRKGGSKMFVELGKEINVMDLLRGVIVQSGNDATIVLAEGLSGSEESFADKMNQKAAALGMKNSNFMNASGWPDPDHYSTAEDLAIMAKKVIEDHPEYLPLYSETEFTYNAIKQPNRNPLLFRNIGADGLKTGHTEDGGYGLIGTAKNENRRVIMVLNGMESEKQRAEESFRLINWGLNSFENLTLAEKGKKLGEGLVTMGKEMKVPLVLGQEIRLTMPRAAKKNFGAAIHYNAPLIAPIKQGQEVGKLILNIPGLEEMTYPVIAGTDIEEVGFFKKTWLKFENFIFQGR